MGGAGGLEDGSGFSLPVGLPSVFHVQHGEHDAFGITQRDLAAAGLERLGQFFVNVERDRHGPQEATGQPHVVAYAFVIRAGHESAQRRETAAHQQFKIADLAGGQVPGGPFPGMGFQLIDSFWLSDKTDEFSTMRRNKVACGSGQMLEPPRCLKSS
jgi:hypothetical protein